MTPHRMRRARRARSRSATGLALGLVAVAMACDPQAPEDDAERDARAVDHGTESLDGAPRLAYFGRLFTVPPGLDPTAHDEVRRAAVEAVEQRLSTTFAAIGCSAAIDGDGDRSVGLTLQGCGLLAWTLDADIEATAEVETEPCDAGTCATAVRWDLDIGTLSIQREDGSVAGFSGPAQLRAALDPTAPMQWQTQPGFVLQTHRGLRFEALSMASFRVGVDECLELDLGARLALEQRDDELDERIGDVVLSVRGLRRCQDRCPETGHVELSFDAGRVLAWEHDGSGMIAVEGPRGRTLEASLPCADEAASE